MKKCEICQNEIENGNNIFNVGDHSAVCYDCATKLALTAKNEDSEIEITEGEYCEAWHLCQWCDELCPESDLQQEVDLGYLCNHCVMAITSRGESVTIRY